MIGKKMGEVCWRFFAAFSGGMNMDSRHMEGRLFFFTTRFLQ
jgi:hypothetical protein